MSQETPTPADGLSDAKRRLLELMLKERQGKATAQQGLVTGAVAITPPQAHEFEIVNPDRHIFNLFLLLEVHVPLEPDWLPQIVRALLEHHDSLRICSVQEESGWRQWLAPMPEQLPITMVDLTALEQPAAQRAAIEQQVAALQGSFDLARGPLFKLAYFQLGHGRPARLLLLVHHMACDHHSSTVLAEDFVTAYQQLLAGQPIKLPAKTTSYLAWSQRLAQHAQSESIRAELPSWLDQPWQRAQRIPRDFPAETGYVRASVGQLLELENFPYLSYQQLKGYQVLLSHALVLATARALIDWAGGSAALLSMCHHGRIHPFRDLDITRTVGWFSYQYPLLLDLSAVATPLAGLKATREQIDRVPHQGLNYGVLRYMAAPALVEQIASVPEPELFVNIRTNTAVSIPGFTPAPEDCGTGMSATTKPPRPLYLNIDINDNQVLFTCLYNSSQLRASAVEAFLRNAGTHLHTLNDAIAAAAG